MHSKSEKSTLPFAELARATVLAGASFGSYAYAGLDSETSQDPAGAVPAAVQKAEPLAGGKLQALELCQANLPKERSGLPDFEDRQKVSSEAMHQSGIRDSAQVPSVKSTHTIQPAADKNPPLWMTIAAAACSLTAMGWYFQQVRRKETAVNVTTLALGATNDLLLCGAALLTGQGLAAAATVGAFAVGGIACTAVAWKQRNDAFRFSAVDRLCAALCVPGMVMLTASRVPAVASYISPDGLAVAGSVLGVAVNLVAVTPLVRDLLAPVVKKEELLDTKKGVARAIALPVLPFAIGTLGLGFALASIPSFSFAHAFQPVALFVTNVALVATAAIWATRRARVAE